MMNKEELKAKSFFYDTHKEVIDLRDVNEFLKTNICIPKGTNRHPYADVLHEWIEGADMEYYDPMFYKWYSNSKVVTTFNDVYAYRIKPQEPVYEWQWYAMVDGIPTTRILDGKSFFTLEEAKECPYILTRFEETKRERKWHMEPKC